MVLIVTGFCPTLDEKVTLKIDCFFVVFLVLKNCWDAFAGFMYVEHSKSYLGDRLNAITFFGWPKPF